ncbi:hypothetical protein ACLOJK_040602 [Asimina triloba]
MICVVSAEQEKLQQPHIRPCFYDDSFRFPVGVTSTGELSWESGGVGDGGGEASEEWGNGLQQAMAPPHLN